MSLGLNDCLRHSHHVVALTGAGVSIESGIPGYRGTGAAALRAETLDPSLEMTLAYAKPNRVHTRLADLERRGYLHGIVTQNIDGLHQLAGSRRVIELHGSWKTKIVKFGDPIPADALAKAEELMFEADLVLVLGTSLSVEPAGSLPFLAYCAGARVIVVNDMETKADDFASIKLNSLNEFLRQTETLIIPGD